MPEAKMRKYAVTLQRRIKSIQSTLTLIVETNHRRKAAFVAENATNRSDASCGRVTGRGWRTQKIEIVDNENQLPNDIDVE